MKKRFISLLLILTMMLPMISAIEVGALSDLTTGSVSGSASIVLDEVWGTPEQTVDLNLTIANNPGILGATLTISWDESLTLVSAKSGDAFGNMEYYDPSRYVASGTNFVWAGKKVSGATDGIALTLSFKISENAKNNDILPVKVTYVHDEVVDGNWNDVSLDITDGSVRVITYMPGDVTGDGKVNIRDLIRLSQYISDGCKTDPEGYNAVVAEAACDVTSDGKVNIRDLIKLSQYISDGCKNDPSGYNVTLYPGKVVCAHSLTATTAKAATCTDAGNIAYWTCSNCGKYFSDADGKNEIKLSDTVVKANGHTYAKAWSTNDTYHWHTATCGHTVTGDYAKHDFDENNICTVCKYSVQSTKSYKDDYDRYSEIGKTVNLITASDFTPASGAKRLFTDAVYNVELDKYNLGDQESAAESYESLAEYSEQFGLDINAKFSFGSRKNKNNGFLTNKLPSISISASYSYEKNKASKTKEYVFSWNYLLNGRRVEMSEFQNKEKLASLLSPDFINDAQKVRSGELSAEDFVSQWGTHVITSGIYGAKLEAEYYEISNNETDYTSRKAKLDLNFQKRLLKTDIELNEETKINDISTSTNANTTKSLNIKGIAKNVFTCTSIDTFDDNLKAWTDKFNEDVDGNSVLVDIGDEGLCCIWYLLDDSYDDVKTILDEYMYGQCEALYAEYLSKINDLKIKDDVTFDKDTGTLELNFETYQKNGTIDGFASDTYVNYEDGVISIMPYYNNEQIKKIVVNGAYKTWDTAGQIIDTLIKDVSIKLETGNWYKDLQIKFRNAGIVGSANSSTIDLTALDDAAQVTLIFVGTNEIIGHDATNTAEAQAALSANDIIFKSLDDVSSLKIQGGNGITRKTKIDNTIYLAQGTDGANGIFANNIVFNICSLSSVTVLGGNGAKPGYLNKDYVGLAGGAAIKATNVAAISGNIIITGGKGASGANGKDGGDGENGEDGYAGGVGGDGIIVDTITIATTCTVTVTGGEGGKGGAGGWGNSSFWEGSKNGGDGGTGGVGGNGISCSKLMVYSDDVTIVGGKGGAGGNGGQSGNKGWNGIGGTGGNGGVGVKYTDSIDISDSCTVSGGTFGDGGEVNNSGIAAKRDGEECIKGASGIMGAMYANNDVSVISVQTMDNDDSTRSTYWLCYGKMKWTEAKELAESLGGHLATITSEDENALLKQMFIDSNMSGAWLGGSDTETNGTWKWVTGETFYKKSGKTTLIYSDWATNEPSNTDNAEHYLGFYKKGDNKWNDYKIESDTVKGFFIEFKSFPTIKVEVLPNLAV